MQVSHQKIIRDYPPNYAAIVETFPAVKSTKGVIFSYKHRIYNPDGVEIAPQIIRHESIHGRRQEKDVQGWWEQYLVDKEFRLTEELEAHIAEYEWCIAHMNRNQRRFQLKAIATRLASPIYGRMITGEEARKILRKVGQ